MKRRFFGLVLIMVLISISFTALADVGAEYHQLCKHDYKVDVYYHSNETYMNVYDAYTKENIWDKSTGVGSACREIGFTVDEAEKVAEDIIGGFAEIVTEKNGSTKLYYSIWGGGAWVDFMLDEKGRVPARVLANTLTTVLHSNPMLDFFTDDFRRVRQYNQFDGLSKRELKVGVYKETYMYVYDAHTIEKIRNINSGVGFACREIGFTEDEATRVANDVLGVNTEIMTDEVATKLCFSIRGGIAWVELLLDEKGRVSANELARALTYALHAQPESNEF